MNSKNLILLAIIIFLFNVIVKSVFAGYPSFSFDEIISIKNTKLEFGHIKHESEWDNNPPFYYYCLWVWHSFFRISEFSARFLSILFMSGGISLFFIWVSKNVNSQIGLYTAVNLSISNFLFFYSQEARSYALVVFLLAISSLLFFRVIRGEWKSFWVLASVNFLIVYTHYIASIVIIIQFTVLLFTLRKAIRNFVLAHAVIVIPLILWRFTMKQYLNILGFNKKEDFWLSRVQPDDLRRGLIELFGTPICAFIVVFFCFSSLVLFLRRKQNAPLFLYLWLMGPLSILILFVIGLFTPVFLSRYIIFTIPFCFALIYFALPPKVSAALFVALLIIQTVNLTIYKYPTMNYKELVPIIKANKKIEDVVLVNTKDNLGLFIYYFDRDMFLKEKDIPKSAAKIGIYGVNEVREIQRIRFQSKSNVFLVQSFHKISQPRNLVLENLQTFCDLKFATDFFHGVEATVLKVVY